MQTWNGCMYSNVFGDLFYHITSCLLYIWLRVEQGDKKPLSIDDFLFHSHFCKLLHLHNFSDYLSHSPIHGFNPFTLCNVQPLPNSLQNSESFRFRAI